MVKTILLRFFLQFLYILLALASVCLSAEWDDGSCLNPETVRVISMEELSSKTGKDDEGDVWISILGQVFDVTEGRSFYGEGTSYSIFAGQDASPCFASGEFNAKGAKKDIEDFEEGEIKGVEHWRKFYWEEDKYKFLGVLDDLYYNKDGNPTSKLIRIQERITAIESTAKKR